MTNRQIRTPSVAITGAAGYIGSRVVHQLQTDHPEWDVTLLDNFYRGQVREIGGVAVRHVDIRDRSRLAAAIGGSDIVMHLAAVSGVEDCEESPDLAYAVNVQGTDNVAWLCRQTGAGLIFPFSMAVLGDPQTFPVTVGHPRAPLNWYGRSKLLGERAIETLADDAFPAHLFLKSNLYGEHRIDGQSVSKATVVNFFVKRALADEPLTVYEPGVQARNYVHVEDVADAYVRSAEQLLVELADGDTGATRYEIASDEDPSVMEVAELVQGITSRELDVSPDIELVENPRQSETLVEEFAVDTSRTHDNLGWEPKRTVEQSISRLVGRHRRGGL